MFLNIVKTFALLAGLSFLLLLLGKLFGGQRGIKIALIIALALNITAYFWSDKIVLNLYKAKPLNKQQYGWIYDITQDLTQKMGIPMPKLWLIESPMANAFATGRNPSHASVALTSHIIDILNKNELRGVISHELGHVKNHDILIGTIAATIATAISYLAMMLRYSTFWGSSRGSQRKGNAIIAIVASIVLPIAATIMQLALSRSREYIADETGANYCQDPLALASALEKLHSASIHNAPGVNSAGKESTASLFIVHPFSSKDMLSLFSTHPPVQDRIKKLRTIHEGMYHR